MWSRVSNAVGLSGLLIAVVTCSGAGLTEKNADAKTPLEVAKLNEQDEIAKLLQDKEADAFL